MRSLLTLLGVLCVAPSLRAAEVLSVDDDGKTLAISQSQDTGGFKVRDYLCVVDDNDEIGCGVVIKALPKGAILKLDFTKESIDKGDRVQFAGGRYPAAVTYDANTATEAAPRRRRIYPFDISAGAVGGLNYVIPTVHFQGMVSTKWAVGILGSYVSQLATPARLTAYGTLLTVNLYTSRYFRGFWFSAGGGLYFLNIENGGSERPTVPAALGTAGYRFGIVRGLNMGIAIGGQYLARPKTDTLILRFEEFQGVATLDLGINF